MMLIVQSVVKSGVKETFVMHKSNMPETVKGKRLEAETLVRNAEILLKDAGELIEAAYQQIEQEIHQTREFFYTEGPLA